MSHTAIPFTALSPSQLAAAAKLFSSSVLQEFAKKGASPTFSRLVRQSGLEAIETRGDTVGAFLDSVFKLLQRVSYRHEYAYKAALTHKVLLGTHSLKTAAMLTEFRVEACKADVAILNGTSTVYEIKSERDRLDRLSSQIAAYRKVFARVNVITGDKHLSAIQSTLPSDVGVLLLNKQFKITTIREAIDAPERVDPVSIFESIHRDEAIQILSMLNIEAPSLPNTQLYASLRSLFARCDPAETHSCMVQVLKKTRSLLPLADLISRIPKSLQPAVIATPIRKQDYPRLIQAVQTTKDQALDWAL